MSALSRWTRKHKTVASATVIALVAGIPLSIAALHPGFPISDVNLTSRDVWVTNGEQLLAGRLNRQINELNGSVVAASANFDVLQDGDTLFMVDPVSSRVESVSPSSTEVTSAIDIPEGSEVTYGGTTLAIVDPEGKLWTIAAVGDLQFNYVSQPPVLELGEGAHAVVTNDGIVIAVSPEKKTIYRIPNLAAVPEERDFPAVGEFQLAAVGDQAVVFDQSTNEVLNQDGTVFPLGDAEGLRLQQTGAESPYAVVATADSLLKVDLGSGDIDEVPAGIDPVAGVAEVSAPVFLDGCAHGAWGGAQKYLLSCDGTKAEAQDIPEPTAGSVLEFRVNRSVIALNDLNNGNVWLVNDNMRLVNNWDDVTPPEEQESEEEGDEKSSIQSFEDTLAERTDVNRPPTAIDDEYGVRPGRTTILNLLENDTDPDGDVLVISAFDSIAEGTGRLDPIDGGRALQFTPNPDFVGIVAFGYTVDDGRDGISQARVTAQVKPLTTNEPPFAIREAGVSVEANQTVSYNVLTDWKDPDGDDIYLVGASPKSGDLVRFTPDGFVTFTHQTSELGEKEVAFQVSDGSGAPAQGILRVQVDPPASLNPVGTPDFAPAFTGETVVVKPLDNDLSPSGAQLALIAMDDPGNGSVSSFNSDRGTISFSSTTPGVYYAKYTLAAGAAQSVGIVRFDVKDKPQDDSIPPVAVKDTAYVRGGEPVTVSVLSNDVSPTGKILAIQSIDVPAELTATGLVVELLESTLIRVTTTEALTEQVNFTYTISDGTKTATAGVTVVPIPGLTKHQPPVAENDAARVRVGDIITLDVLANDFHPDDSSMFLQEELLTLPTDGIAFVSKNQLRFQAPETPGEYRVDYRVIDPFGETAAATAVFTVVGLDAKANRDPVPLPLVGRVLAGGSIRIDIPLNGIDPDGDSTQLLQFSSNPTLGSIVENGNDYFIYESSPASTGTDTFTYQVYDAFGATGTADIRIAVIPEPAELQEPTAVPDSVSIRPGRTAQVDLTLNDSDPQSAPIKVSKQLVDVPDGIKAEVVGKHYLVITAPETEQSFTLQYELTNDRGGKTMSYVLVQVTPQAPLLPPTAEDLPIARKDIAGKKSITVNVLDGSAFNPSGRTEDLVVSLDGPNAKSAELLEVNGQIEVTPGPTRQAIAYRVTNEQDDLSALAFILVPAAVDESFDDPPLIDPNLPIQYVSMNETRQWTLPDIVDVPSGRDPHIYNEETVTGVQSNGAPILVDANTLEFTPPTNYRGPAAINFTVSDGDSKDDPKANTANLRLNIVVGDPEFRDTPPEFTTPNTQVEVGETTTIDLRQSTGHPNPQILQQVTYSDITGAGDTLQASLNGSTLTLSTPRNTPKGTTFTLGVTLRWDKFTVPGTINVTVVGSTRPKPVAVTDPLETQRGDGAVTVNPLVNDSNPYQTTGEPLKIVAAVVENTGEPAGVTFTEDSVRISPSPSLKSGTINVIYTIEDATQDADRRSNGTITLVVSDVPDQVQKPTRDQDSAIGGDKQATIRFVAPATNGKDITSYNVRSSPSVGTPTNCTAGAQCTITGLNNGEPYTFSVQAVNEHGPGEWSAYSDQITPYGTPAAVAPTAALASPWAPTGAVNFSWPAVGGTGGQTTYYWQTSNGVTGSTPGTSASMNGLGAGSYSISVYAQNTGGKSGATGTSNAVDVQNQTVPSQVGTPSTTVTDGEQPGAISWSWTPITGSPQMTDNVVYEVTLSGVGVVQTGAQTSYSRSGLNAGDYSITVRAINNAGGGPSSAASPNGHIENPPPPPAEASVPFGTPGTCQTRSNEGGPYNVQNACLFSFTVSNFPAGRYDVTPYNDFGAGGPVSRTYTVDIPANGRVDVPNAWMQSGNPQFNAWVVISGWGETPHGPFYAG
ncbi:MAG: Ig-like domain-containing protein [Rhodoglobus sp.]